MQGLRRSRSRARATACLKLEREAAPPAWRLQAPATPSLLCVLHRSSYTPPNQHAQTPDTGQAYKGLQSASHARLPVAHVSVLEAGPSGTS